MSFVFEARRLPFDSDDDDVATAQVIEWLGAEGAQSLTCWQRRLFGEVMRVVLQRPSTLHSHGGSDDAQTARTAPSDKLAEPCDQPPSRSPLGLRAPESEDVEVTQRILVGLDDLEAAYCHAMDVRKSLRRQSRGEDERVTGPALSAEEAIMAELLRERGGEEAVADFFAVTRPQDRLLAEDKDEPADSDVVDLAMCFDLEGQPIGMGAPAVFGGHGYHPMS